MGDHSDVEQAWEDEAERRYQRYLAGEEECISAAQALAEIRAELCVSFEATISQGE